MNGQKRAKWGLWFTTAVVLVAALLLSCGQGNANENRSGSEVDTGEVIVGDFSLIETQAKQAFLDSFPKEFIRDATIDEVSFKPFLGIYDGALVAGFDITQNVFDFPDVVNSIEIDGVYIEWWVGIPILVWKDGSLFKLRVAAEQGILSKENLTAVKELFLESRTN
jgi:hypothetical protein